MRMSDALHPGPIALVGSGEYLRQMEPVDEILLQQVGGSSARVVVLPTAAGLEDPASPRRWADMGMRHFTRLGSHVEAAHILVRDDAFDERWQPMLQQADFIYFSGGSPHHLIETMAGSPVWATIAARHAAGAVLAGCSAGAMAFGHVSLQPRRTWTSRNIDGAAPSDTWYPALDLVPNVVVLPHFDRWMARMGDVRLKQLAASLSRDVTLIGVDEDTALVTLASDSPTWQVLGRQGVSIIAAERGQVRYTAGDTIVLADGVLVDAAE